MAKERVNITLGHETMKKLLAECNRLDLSRSQYISLLINEKLSDKITEERA